MSKPRVTIVISNVQKSLAFEWIARGLKKQCDLAFVLLNPDVSPLETFLKNEGLAVTRITYRGSKDAPWAALKLFQLFLSRRPNVMHAHLLDAQLIGLAVAWFLRIRNRVYTRHNSTFHHLYFPASVKYDRFSNRLATQIISISQATDDVLLQLEQVSPKKLVRIPHGFDLDEFSSVDEARVQTLRVKWKISNQGPRIGVIARQIEWKGIQYVIPAFKSFLSQYPDALLILANASGPFQENIEIMLRDIGARNVVRIPFEEDVAALYRLFDLYVHVPIDSTCEAFGQTYVEALASGVPSIFTLSGIAAEFIEDRKNARVVPFQDAAAISSALSELWQNEAMRQQLIESGKQSVKQFDLPFMLNSLLKVYER
jgi:glycosyltransferase involved in cell wall biosynthesis